MTTASKFPTPESLDDSIEETAVFAPRFNADGLIPAIATSASGGALLMLAWMNEDALLKTIETKEAHYWSRSRQQLWRKGATSGNIQKVVEIRTDCDQDAIQLVVEQSGPACHTDRKSCFYRLIESDDGVALRLSD